jgi:hypothetical protein
MRRLLLVCRCAANPLVAQISMATLGGTVAWWFYVAANKSCTTLAARVLQGAFNLYF